MNSTLRIELDGTLITGRVDGLDSFVVTLRSEDEEGKVASSFSSELTFYDDGYQIINSKLIQPVSGFGDYVSVKLYDDYCGLMVFEGRINGDGIDWCEPNCYVSANIIQVDPQVSCIQNTMIWDNHNGFLSRSYNPVEYCIEIRPQFLMAMLDLITTVISGIIYFVLGVLVPVVVVVWAICKLINILAGVFGGDGVSCTGEFSNPREWIELITEIAGIFQQCGHKHPSPFVRDYIQNVCNKCGLTFKSSILNDPAGPYAHYYYLAMMAAQVDKGKYKTDNDELITDNLPVETLSTLMQTYLMPLFNARFKIIGNDLIFERKDYFFNSTNIWVDADDLISRGLVEDNSVCYTWTDKERPSYGNFEYSMDASEYIGNEVRRRWEDIVEWNPAPTNASQKGPLDVLITASAARCPKDGLPSYYANSGPDAEPMIMSQHRAFNYKFLILNELTKSWIKSDYPDSFTGGSIPGVAENQRVNYPMWFREGYAHNLYSDFHYINNPRLPGSTNYDFRFTFAFDCATYQSFSFDKTVSLIMGGQVKYGQVKELSVDFNKRTISVKGIV